MATFLQILIVGGARDRNVRVLMVRCNREDLAYVAELCQGGKLVPAIDRSYALSEAGEALRSVGEGRTKGKVVITVPAHPT